MNCGLPALIGLLGGLKGAWHQRMVKRQIEQETVIQQTIQSLSAMDRQILSGYSL